MAQTVVVLGERRPADHLALSVTSADGRVTRWGADEASAGDVPLGLQITTSVPGGYKDLSCVLPRRIDLDFPDLRLFDRIRCYGPGNETVFDGRQAQFPRSYGDEQEIEVGAVGLSAHLRDDTSFVEVYVDRDPGAWREPSLDERVRLAGVNHDMGKFSWAVELGGFICTLPSQALEVGDEAQVWYHAPAGVTLAKVGYKGAETSWPSTANISQQTLYFTVADTFDGTDSVTLTLDGTVREAPSATDARRYVMFNVFAAAAHTPSNGALRSISKIAVYGNHGLTIHDITDEPDGVLASDVIADVLSRAAPLLPYTTGEGGSIETTSFVIPHLTFKKPTTAEQAILELNKFHLYEWGYYDGLFFWRGTDPDRLCWEVRQDQGAHLQLEGDTGEEVFNGVLVSYRDAGDGTDKVVGPPAEYWQGGTARADATDEVLVDTSETNPVNEHGIPRRWAHIDLSNPATEAGAVQIGQVFLAEKSLARRRGSLVVSGIATHPTKGIRPAWAIRAGDYVKVTDHSADVRRRVIETRYDHDTRKNTLTLDNTPYKLEALHEWLGASLVGVLS